MYYPKFKTFQILIPLLKEHNIRHIVISPGSRMREFILAVEEDSFFITYNVTDERSASYFAIGISQQLNMPVAITCTSSTATTNYVPGITEAFYQMVPILILTGDRDPYMLGQQEDQMINQVGMYDRITRKSVTLPIVNNDADIWYCNRLINEAILELNHRKSGPVHVNIPVPAMITWENDKPITDYPPVRVIQRLTIEDKWTKQLTSKIDQLNKANKILVLAGQNIHEFEMDLLSSFFSKFNCIIHAEHMGNIIAEGKLNIVAPSEGIPPSIFDDFMPDIIISFHGTLGITRSLKENIRKRKCEHWLIDEEGEVIDSYKNLTTIFECTPTSFFKYFNQHAPEDANNNKIYYNKWAEALNKVEDLKLKFSNVFVIKNLLSLLPDNSILHLSILNSVRISQYYNLPVGTKVYANIGTDGIDGCMSTFFGQACVTEKESFLIIGDLSFFYDMSSLRIKHNKSNIHLLLINNHGGNEFYQQPIMPTTDQGLGAKHSNSAKAWAESTGFRYLSAHTEAEYIDNIDYFVKSNLDRPILFEVFTEQMADREMIFGIKDRFGISSDKNAKIKKTVKSLLGDENVKSIKKILGKI